MIIAVFHGIRYTIHGIGVALDTINKVSPFLRAGQHVVHGVQDVAKGHYADGTKSIAGGVAEAALDVAKHVLKG